MGANGSTKTGGREATEGHIPGDYALSVGLPEMSPPVGWRWSLLTDIARLESGHTPSRKYPEYWGGEIPWVGIKDATGNHGQVIDDTIQHTNQLGIENSSARVLPEQTVCLSRTASVGYVIVMGKPMATSQDFVNWVCSDMLNPHFLKYVLLAEKRSFSRFSHGTTHQTIYFPEVKAFHLCHPPLEEQDKIVHVLKSLDNKIQLNRQTNQTLEQMAQALFKSWFVDFDPVIDNALAAGNSIPPELELRAQQRIEYRAQQQTQQQAPAQAASNKAPQANTEAHSSQLPQHLRDLFPSEFEHTEALGWVPKGWGVMALDEIAHYQNGLALQKFRPEDEENFLPVLKISHLKRGFTDGKEKASPNIKSSCIVDDGDVIFSWSASLMVDIWCGGKAALNQHLFKVTSEDYPRWFYYSFTIHHLLEFQRIASDKAVTMGHIKKEHLSQAKCVVPPLSFLDNVGGNIGAILDKQVLLRQESNELAKLRDTLLPKLISGELRLTDAEMDAPTLINEASA